MARLWLNIDLGELPDEPEELFALADVASLACGGHAGDDESMALALARCRARRTRAGAHPSFPDREGFGRRALELDPRELARSIEAQCTRLAGHAARAGVAIEFVKPHGALYHAADRDPTLAETIVRAAGRALGGDVTWIGPPGGELAAAAGRAGLRFAREAFADRDMRLERGRWRLVPRDRRGAVVSDPRTAASQTHAFAVSGAFDTICVHGDGRNALAVARAVRAALGPRAADEA